MGRARALKAQAGRADFFERKMHIAHKLAAEIAQVSKGEIEALQSSANARESELTDQLVAAQKSASKLIATLRRSKTTQTLLKDRLRLETERTAALRSEKTALEEIVDEARHDVRATEEEMAVRLGRMKREIVRLRDKLSQAAAAGGGGGGASGRHGGGQKMKLNRNVARYQIP